MMMKELSGNSYLFGSNAPFIEALYEAYLKDPQSVEPRWRGFFDELQRLDDGPRDVSHAEVQERFIALARERRPAAAGADARSLQKQFAVLQLISAYRFQGCRIADVDPLGRLQKPVIAELDPAFYGLGEADLDTALQLRHAASSRIWPRCATSCRRSGTPIAAASASSTCTFRTFRRSAGCRSGSSLRAAGRLTTRNTRSTSSSG